jgi:hypothetical protein
LGSDVYDALMAQGHALASMVSVIVASMLLVASRRLKDVGAVYAGLLTVVMGTGWWLLNASAVPDPSHIPALWSIRALSGMVIILAMAPIVVLSRSASADLSPLLQRIVSGVALIIFSFAFFTIEVTWPETITLDRLYGIGPTQLIDDAWNRFHLRMSGTWIVYSILLMALGFVRRLRAVRVGALLLLLVTILKVFLYDLSFLEQPYRIVSFIALGVILLLAGFLYQRFKHVILNAPLDASNPGPEDQGSAPH